MAKVAPKPSRRASIAAPGGASPARKNSRRASLSPNKKSSKPGLNRSASMMVPSSAGGGGYTPSGPASADSIAALKEANRWIAELEDEKARREGVASKKAERAERRLQAKSPAKPPPVVEVKPSPVRRKPRKLKKDSIDRSYKRTLTFRHKQFLGLWWLPGGELCRIDGLGAAASRALKLTAANLALVRCSCRCFCASTCPHPLLFQCHRLFSEVDFDKSGTLSTPEFIDLMGAQDTPFIRALLGVMVFNQTDVNNDGVMEFDEVRVVECDEVPHPPL